MISWIHFKCLFNSGFVMQIWTVGMSCVLCQQVWISWRPIQRSDPWADFGSRSSRRWKIPHVSAPCSAYPWVYLGHFASHLTYNRSNSSSQRSWGCVYLLIHVSLLNQLYVVEAVMLTGGTSKSQANDIQQRLTAMAASHRGGPQNREIKLCYVTVRRL